MSHLRRYRRWFGTYHLAAAACLAYFYCVSALLVPGLGIRPALAVEFVVLTYVVALIRTFQRTPSIAVTAGAGLSFLLYTACFVKYLAVREPITVLDFHNLDELCFTLRVPRFAVLVALLMFAWPLLRNFALPRARRGYLLLIPLAVYAVGIWTRPHLVTAALRAVQTPVLWRSDLNVFRNGLLMTFLTDAAAVAQFRRDLAAPSGPGAPASMLPPLAGTKLRLTTTRNIHIVVIESLLDPLRLTGANLPADPFDPRFRSWVTESESVLLAPSFGGASARAEFEVLCGLPSYGLVDVELNHLRGAPVPCLPAVLRAHDYLTVTSNPAPRTFFNYQRAYPAMGFEEIHSADDFDFGDVDGQWLSNDSFLRQHLEFLAVARRSGRPLFTYAFTNAGHFPFELDTSRRPPLFPDDKWTERAANALHYTTKAIADFVETIEKQDPDAIIIVIGDHLPLLGTGWGEYRTRGYRPPHAAEDFWSDETSTLLAMRGTIAIIRRGGSAIRVGLLAHYELPELLLDLLTDGRYCHEHSCFSKQPFVYRPNGQQPIYFERRAPSFACLGTPACEAGRADLELGHEATLRRYKTFMQGALLLR